MSKLPLILITNDDGVHAEGIKHLWKSLQGLAELVVVAPANEQSAVGLSITIRNPIHLRKEVWQNLDAVAWSVSGTPADCIKLALNAVLPRYPDLIVSGINKGSNAGRNVLYSGTVGAVIEGTMRNIPGIAFSSTNYFSPAYNCIEEHIPGIVNYVMSHPLPSGTFLNVNFPDHMDKVFKGIRMAKQGRGYYGEAPLKRNHPFEDMNYFWLGIQPVEFDEHEQSDILYLQQGYATAVPIRIEDLTHRDVHDERKEHFNHFVNAKN